MVQRASKIGEAQAWFDAFNQNSDLQAKILERIKDRLRNEGTDEDNEVIGYYSFVTSLINPKKVFNTHYTLLDTGEFYASLFVQWFPGFITIDGNGQKGDDNLFQKHGDGIIGLAETDKEWLIGQLRIRFVDYVERVLFGY